MDRYGGHLPAQVPGLNDTNQPTTVRAFAQQEVWTEPGGRARPSAAMPSVATDSPDTFEGFSTRP